MTTTLSTRSLLNLLDLFEQSHQTIPDDHGRPLRGVLGQTMHQQGLTASQIDEWSERVGDAGEYRVPYGDEHVFVELDWENSPDLPSYRCPETFLKKKVPAEMVAIRAVKVDFLMQLLADLFGIPKALQRGIDKPLLEAAGTLWHLGKTRIGNLHVETWLVRGLVSEMESVFRYFENAALPDAGIIFTTGSNLPNCVKPPRSYRIIPMKQVVVAQSKLPALDRDLLHRLMIAAPGSSLQENPVVFFDPFTNTLQIATRNIEPWTITGKKQAIAVRLMVEELHKGRRRVTAREILLAAHGSSEAAKGKRVASIFNGSPRAPDYIENDDEGYGIKLE